MSNGWVKKNRDWLGKQPPRKQRRKEEPPPEKPTPEKKKPSDDENCVGCVAYTDPWCPKCGGFNVPSYSKEGRIRYRKCKDCGHTFPSYPQNREKNN